MENKTKVNVSTTDIRQYIKDEYKRCSIDPIHFIRNHIFIQTQDKGVIKFSLFDFQEQALKDIHANDRSIILKSRQMGISTLISAYCLWQLIFHDGKNILIVSIKEGTAKEIVAKIRLANEKLPTYLKLKELENNKLSIKFKNNSMVQAVSSASSAGRSFSASLIILDEAAFIENVEELWLSIQPTLSTTKEGKAIILSTPRGMSNFFHKTWTDSENKRNEFFKIKLPWNLRPDRDESWKAKQMLELGAKDFGQEYDCDFLSSGNSLIALDLLQWYEKELCKDPIELRYGGGLWIFKYPDYSKDYVVTADSGRGDATDYSAFHVFEIETMEQVAEYKDQIGTKEYGNLLVNVAAEYNNALLIVERENIGWAVLQQIIDRDYQNTFYISHSYSHPSNFVV